MLNFVGNVTRTCGINNEWLPAKIYCIREQISMVFAEVGLTYKHTENGVT